MKSEQRFRLWLFHQLGLQNKEDMRLCTVSWSNELSLYSFKSLRTCVCLFSQHSLARVLHLGTTGVLGQVILAVGAILCIAEYLAASLISTC